MKKDPQTCLELFGSERQDKPCACKDSACPASTEQFVEVPKELTPPSNAQSQETWRHSTWAFSSLLSSSSRPQRQHLSCALLGLNIWGSLWHSSFTPLSCLPHIPKPERVDSGLLNKLLPLQAGVGEGGQGAAHACGLGAARRGEDSGELRRALKVKTEK